MEAIKHFPFAPSVASSGQLIGKPFKPTPHLQSLRHQQSQALLPLPLAHLFLNLPREAPQLVQKSFHHVALKQPSNGRHKVFQKQLELVTSILGLLCNP